MDSGCKVFVAIVFGALIISLCCHEANAQRTPKPTPTPPPAAQIEPSSGRTTPDQAPAKVGGQVNQPNRMSGAEAPVNDSIKSLAAGRISAFRITVRTGEDDLRDNSAFGMFLIMRDGSRIDSPPLNCEQILIEAGPGPQSFTPLFGPTEWFPKLHPKFVKGYGNCHGIPNNGERTFEWVEKDFGQGIVIQPADVSRIGIKFRSGRTNQTDTGDNWNLDKLEVQYIITVPSKTNAPGTYKLYKDSGSPLYRFKTQAEWQSNALPSPQ